MWQRCVTSLREADWLCHVAAGSGLVGSCRPEKLTRRVTSVHKAISLGNDAREADPRRNHVAALCHVSVGSRLVGSHRCGKRPRRVTSS